MQPVTVRLRPLVTLLLVLGVGVTLYALIRTRRDDLVDFAVYRTAAARAIDAAPLYRPEDGHYQFKYLPAFAVAMAPFALVPREAANAVWTTIVVGLAVVFVRRSVSLVPSRRLADRRLRWLTALVLARFFVAEITFGQSNLLLGVVLLAAVAAIAGGRRGVAGALVGLAVFIKPYAVILIPWLVVTSGPIALAAAGAVVLAGLALPAAIYGGAANVDLLVAWFRTVTGTSGPNLLHPENMSISSMWAKLLGIGPVAERLSVVTGVVALAGAALIVAWRRRAADPLCLEFGALMLLVPLLSPQGWDYVLLLSAPALGLLVDRWRDLPVSWRVISGLSLGVMSFLIFDVVGRTAYMWLTGHGVLTPAALAVLATLAAIRWRREG